MESTLEFQRVRIEALENELKRVNDILAEISEISTKKALDIKVILNEKRYEINREIKS